MSGEAMTLEEELLSVPKNTRLIIDSDDGKSTMSIPVGVICAGAMRAIAELRHHQCPHIVSADEGTQYCGLNNPAGVISAEDLQPLVTQLQVDVERLRDTLAALRGLLSEAKRK